MRGGTFGARVGHHPLFGFAVVGAGDVVGRLAFGRFAGPGRVALARRRRGAYRHLDGDLLAVLPAPHDLRLRFALGPARQRHVVAFVDRHVAGALLVDDVRWNCHCCQISNNFNPLQSISINLNPFQHHSLIYIYIFVFPPSEI